MVYEARYGVTPKGIGVIAICLFFVLSAVLIPDFDSVMRILCIVFFGGGGLFLLAMQLKRDVALRADGEGVTLGGLPFRPSTATAVVPWSEITAIVLFKQKVAYTSMPYVGLERRAGLPPPAGVPGGKMTSKSARFLIPHVPPEVVAASRPINGWKLDRERLEAAVRHHAPQVAIIDAG